MNSIFHYICPHKVHIYMQSTSAIKLLIRWVKSHTFFFSVLQNQSLSYVTAQRIHLHLSNLTLENFLEVSQMQKAAADCFLMGNWPFKPGILNPWVVARYWAQCIQNRPMQGADEYAQLHLRELHVLHSRVWSSISMSGGCTHLQLGDWSCMWERACLLLLGTISSPITTAGPQRRKDWGSLL